MIESPLGKLGPVGSWMEDSFRHFNAHTTLNAARAYAELIANGGKMLISMAGAMSTGEIGAAGLAEMIRRGYVHFISCTGANLEEDVMNLIGHDDYVLFQEDCGPNTNWSDMRWGHYEELKPEEEQEILNEGLNRVTDTAIPEEEVFGPIHDELRKLWTEAKEKNFSKFPHEYLYRILRSGVLDHRIQIDPDNSWMLAAAKANLPIVCPGQEDSSMGNAFQADVMNGEYPFDIVKSGHEAMVYLANWYLKNADGEGVGFFQIGGGISGDFPICAVPMLTFDAKKKMPDGKDVPAWSYFAQIRDSNTSYGGYSGAVPNEKITWGKLNVDTPKFDIEGDASVFAPLVFAYVLGW